MKLAINDHIAELRGDLDYGTVLKWRQLGFDYVSSCETQVVFNFSQVTKMDSAGVALLLEWWRAAMHAKKTITFKNLPVKAKALIALSDLSDILGVMDIVVL